MLPQIRKDVLTFLSEAHEAVRSENFSLLYGVSNHLIHSMSVYQDRDAADCSVAVLALAKIFEKEKYLEHDYMEQFKRGVLKNLDDCRAAAEQNNAQAFSTAIQNLFGKIKLFDKKMKLFEQPLLEYAKVEKASKLVEHGLSVSQASQYMQIPEWELAHNVGCTTACEIHAAEPMTNLRRVAYAKKLFGMTSDN